jgi:RNA polymerase sigma-70 factor (ECF subfamily)
VRQSIDEQTLIAELRSGNKAAFRQFITAYERLVAQLVFRMIPNEADRDDVCQEIFIKAWEYLPSFRQDCKLSTWLARIAYNHCLNFLEKKRIPLYEDMTVESTIDDVVGDETTPSEVLDERDRSHRLHSEIDNLPVLMGTVLTLYHFCEMQYDEISRLMQLPEGTVKSHLFRARQALKNSLLAKYDERDLW